MPPIFYGTFLGFLTDPSSSTHDSPFADFEFARLFSRDKYTYGFKEWSQLRMKPPIPKRRRRQTPSTWLSCTNHMVSEEKALMDFLRECPDECSPMYPALRASMTRVFFEDSKDMAGYKAQILRLFARLQYEGKVFRSCRNHKSVLFIPDK